MFNYSNNIFCLLNQIKQQINLNSRHIWQAGHSGHSSTLLPEKGCQYRFHKNLGLRSSSIKYTKESMIALEKAMATHSTILAGELHGQRSLAGYSYGVAESPDMTEWLIHARNQRKTKNLLTKSYENYLLLKCTFINNECLWDWQGGGWIQNVE